MSKLCGFNGLLGAVIVKAERASAGDVGKDAIRYRDSIISTYVVGFLFCFVLFLFSCLLAALVLI